MADDTAPSFATGFPMATSISGGDLDLLVKLDEPGKFHYAILPTGSTAPTAAEMQASSNSDAVACSPTAGVAVLSSTSSVTVSITSTSDYTACAASATLACNECPNLSSETTYDVYVLAQDDNSASGAGRDNNVQTLGSPLTLVTADVTAPAFDPADGTYPSDVERRSRFATIGVALGEIGTAYFLVVANASTAPTASQVKAQGNSYTPSGESAVTVVKKGTISATTASTEFTASLTGLDDLTAYSVCAVMEDQGNTDTSTNVYATTAPNLAATPSRAWFTTADGTPPEFTGEYTPGVSSVAGDSFDVDVALGRTRKGVLRRRQSNHRRSARDASDRLGGEVRDVRGDDGVRCHLRHRCRHQRHRVRLHDGGSRFQRRLFPRGLFAVSHRALRVEVLGVRRRGG